MSPERTNRPNGSNGPSGSPEDTGLRDGFSAVFARRPSIPRRGLLPGRRVWITFASAAAVTALAVGAVPLAKQIQFTSDDTKKVAAAKEPSREPGKPGGGGSSASGRPKDADKGAGPGQPAGSGGAATGGKGGSGQPSGSPSTSAAGSGGSGGGSASGSGGSSGSTGSSGATGSSGSTGSTGSSGSGSSGSSGSTGSGSGGSSGSGHDDPGTAFRDGGIKPLPQEPPKKGVVQPAKPEIPRPPKLDDGRIKGPVMGFAAKRCVDIVGGKSKEGAPLELDDCSGDRNQRFEFRPDGEVWSLYDDKLCLDTQRGSTADGAAVQLADCNGKPTQAFAIQRDGSLVNSKSGKCVEAADSGSKGLRLQLQTCNGAKKQKWQIG